SKGLTVGWDLAHAAGNVPLSLHGWNVDFAAWCTYKYINAGPGSIAGLFVHERHGRVEYKEGEERPVFRHRLEGWYGGDQVGRFNMDNTALREKSVQITAYLEHLLLAIQSSDAGARPFRIITPSDPNARGTQLSILLKPGILDTLAGMLEEAGI
ncbi:hypothetical protein DH86_00000858, partial [Scytalidium sp. 3C]